MSIKRPLEAKLVIFDLDGTLVDAYSAIEKALNAVRVHFNREPVGYNEVKSAVGWGDKNLIKSYFSSDEAERALEIYRQEHAKTLLEHAKLMPFAEDILNYLKSKGYFVALASNRPAAFAGIILKNLGISIFFDYVICADEIDVLKPAPDMVLKIAKDLNVELEKSVYVGDMTIDIQTAENAGIIAIAIATGTSPRKDLENKNPYAVIGSLIELKNLL
ncbi:MAG: HAD family hydrolase [Candidatus Omnitrophica bacterium]|nr:HAD family hydrolase [Candidatus Omnitrophota bacterium]